jgi:DNA-binding transcriptional LysR family regulator
VNDWDDLRIFLAVARAGSLSSAARGLGVAQPTVGRRITAFERRLGAKLFLSQPSGQALSATGQRMLQYAEHMELEALGALRMASGRDVGLRGRVVITASEWMIRSVLAPLVGPFSASHPELELELLAEIRHLSLLRREADIAVRPSRFEQQDVIERRLATLSFGLYASDAYLARYGSPDFSTQCAGQRLIAMSESLKTIADVEWLAALASRASTVVRTNGREAMVALVQAGVGMACLPRFMGDGAPGLRRVPTPGAVPERQLWLGLHRDARAVPRVRSCAAFLVKGIARLEGALRPAE